MSKLFSSEKKEARKFKFGKSKGLGSYKSYIIRLQQNYNNSKDITDRKSSEFSKQLSEREFRKGKLPEGELRERKSSERQSSERQSSEREPSSERESSSEQIIWQCSEEFEKEFRTIREIIEELRVE